MRTEDGACVGGGGGVEEFWTLRFVRDVGEGEQGDGIGDWRLGTGLLTKGGEFSFKLCSVSPVSALIAPILCLLIFVGV